MPRSVDVRKELTEALRLDLVGPRPDGPYADEVLTDRPSTWYLTGFLVPFEASEETRRGDDADDVLDSAAHAGHDDDADDGDRASARRTWFSSTIGLSVPRHAHPSALRATYCTVANLSSGGRCRGYSSECSYSQPAAAGHTPSWY